ncbi:MAG: MgtC/SapB family protein [Hyphomicrobium sp.]
MDTFELVGRLAVALAIGLVIGIERGWKQRGEAEGERAAGLHTLALSGLLGGIWGALALNAGQAGLIALALAFTAFTAAIAVFRYREMVHEKTFGATTVVAAMLAFALGALAVLGDKTAAAAAGVAAALLLALKSALHEWVKRLTWEELRAGLILAAMTVILLPLVPDCELSPAFPVNPHEIWLLTILIAALSFAGYVAIRLAGPSIGVLLSGLAGGLVSSTAVTLNMARLARADGERRNVFAAGVLAAGAVMMLRVLVIVGIVNVALLPSLTLPLVLAALALAGIAGYLANWGHEDCPVGKPISLQNPFELRVVLEFGGLLAVIMAATKLLSAWAGSGGRSCLPRSRASSTSTPSPSRSPGLRLRGSHPRARCGRSSWRWWRTAYPRSCLRWPWAAGRSAGSWRAQSRPHLLWRRSGSRQRCCGDALPRVLVGTTPRAVTAPCAAT